MIATKIINPKTDELITIAQAVEHFPKINGKSKPKTTIYKYCSEGVNGIILETYCDCGKIYTTAEAVKLFLLQFDRSRAEYIESLQKVPDEPPKKLYRPRASSLAKRREAALKTINSVFKKRGSK